MTDGTNTRLRVPCARERFGGHFAVTNYDTINRGEDSL